MAAATLLGSATATGTTLLIPITTAVPGDGILIAAYTIANSATAFADNATFIGAAVDSKAAGWTLSNSGVNVGITRDSLGVTTVACGAVSRAATATGDLVAGDQVQLTVANSAYPASCITAGLVVFIGAVDFTAVAQAEFGSVVFYGNGDGGNGAAAPPTLSWVDDYGDSVEPLQDAVMITVAGAKGGGHWNPLNGSVAGQKVGSCSCAVSVVDVAAASSLDPGGRFSGGGMSVLAANYQYALATGAGASVISGAVHMHAKF